MPAGAPFTRLCQLALPGLKTGRADLHMHSTASDGLYTPTQLVDIARRTGLAAIALTDHDTMAGFEEAKQAAGSRLEVIPAVEISCDWNGREVHLLGYFVDPEHGGLKTALHDIRESRTQRFEQMIGKLRDMGVVVSDRRGSKPSAIGRRHLAHLLVESGAVGSIREAFNRYIDDDKPAFVQKMLLELKQAIRLIREAGGVSSYAHPGNELSTKSAAELADSGLNAIEVEYPTFKNSRKTELRQWAKDLGLAITGGTDCHGPEELKRAVGRCTIDETELAKLRKKCPASTSNEAIVN